MRRGLLSVVGSADAERGSEPYVAAFEVGCCAIDAGFRVVTGGRYGVAEAAARGARESGAYREGDTIGVLPGADPTDANQWVDIVLATGMDLLRGGIIANTDVIVAIGGGAGTLSEIAFAWMYRRPIIALNIPGWSSKLAGERLDERKRQRSIRADRIFAASSPSVAIKLAERHFRRYTERHRGVGRR